MRLIHNEGNATLVGLISMSAVAFGLFHYSKQSQLSREIARSQTEMILAENYATELLEFLRSYKSPQLVEYYKVNPCSASGCSGSPACSTCAPYFLCSHVNLLDRENTNATKTVVLNPDPMADLPSPFSLDGPTNATKANRYYQVQVVNIKTLGRVASHCDKTAAAPGFALGPDERFLITVGVSWVPKGRGPKDVKRVVLSTIIPTNP